ncbi:hypothetical protein LINPERPRIM_LOCUS23862 [Linum perenne]
MAKRRDGEAARWRSGGDGASAAERQRGDDMQGKIQSDKEVAARGGGTAKTKQRRVGGGDDAVVRSETDTTATA